MLKLYNTLTRKKDSLRAGPRKKLRLFVCGPTVYDYSHLGHARTYLVFDAFVRYLSITGYKVDYLQNITNIDDKIIQRAKEKNVSPKALAAMFERAYLKDMKALGIESVSKYARATDHIKEIISQVQRLQKKGYAYEIKGDGLYYDIKKFKNYGALSGRTALQAKDAVSRIDESNNKRNRGDFALWKLTKYTRDSSHISRFKEPSWPSPWGAGRPGWHIEDTAITEKHFGPQYELHGGAQDLIFPHHEAEIAQMEALSGKRPMAKHWMHTGFLTVKGEKMSKSLGNFVTVREFLQQHSPRVVRLVVLKTHYRSPIDYSEKLLLQTERELERIDEFVERLQAKQRILSSTKELLSRTKDAKQAFWRALEDDFNTPKAIAALFDLITQANNAMDKGKVSAKDAKAIGSFLQDADSVFGFVFSKEKKTSIPANILTLVKEREKYRKNKEWQKADQVRKKLSAQDWRIDDTPQGPRLKRR